MTVYEKIREFTIEDMANFVMELINTTEIRLLQQLQDQGINCSIVRPSPELQYADNLVFLLKEVDDEHDEYDEHDSGNT